MPKLRRLKPLSTLEYRLTQETFDLRKRAPGYARRGTQG